MKVIYCDVVKWGICLDFFVLNIFFDVYVKIGFLKDVLNLFDEMFERNYVLYVIFSWVNVCEDFVGFYIRLYWEGYKFNLYVFIFFLKWFVRVDKVEIGWWLYFFIVKFGFIFNVFVGVVFINVYVVCGVVDSVRSVFEGILRKDVVVWVGIVFCYVENGFLEDFFEFFFCMGMEGFMFNNYIFVCVLKVSIGLGVFGYVKSVYGRILKMCYELDFCVGIGLF